MGSDRILLEGGAEVEYDTKAQIIEIGNGRGVPERFSLVHPGGPNQPSFRFEFGVMNKIPVCVGVHIEAKDGIPVRTRDLSGNHIDKLVISAVSAAAFEATPGSKPGRRGWRKPHGDMAFNAASLAAGQVAVKSKPRTRRSRDDVDLKRVAETWRNATPGAKTEALMTVFFCSKATAARYKKRAVEEGLLDG
jgi:hypothetical protein